MGNRKKAERVQDADIKRLNHLGLGLNAIAETLGCHAATVTIRLKAMGITPTDTRRSFMERVYNKLTPDQRDWLSHNLFNSGISVQDFVAVLIQEAYQANTAEAAPVAPPPMPEMETTIPETRIPVTHAEAATMELAGGVFEPSPDPSPEVMVEPEHVREIPVEPPNALPKSKIHFG